MRFSLVSTNEKNFILHSFLKGFHKDGRNLFQQRSAQFSYSQTSPTTLVASYRLGKTALELSVAASVVTPEESRPNNGIFSVGFATASFVQKTEPKFACAQNKSRISFVRWILKKALLKSGIVDREQLCILGKRFAWKVEVSLSVVFDDGNLLCAAFEATVNALGNFKFPANSVENGKITLFSFEEKEPLQLFSAFKDEQSYFAENNKKSANLQGVAVFVRSIHGEEQNEITKAGYKDISYSLAFRNASSCSLSKELEEGEIRVDEDCALLFIDPTYEEEVCATGIFFFVFKQKIELLYSKYIGDESLSEGCFTKIIKLVTDIIR